jgi:hypothetical protein
MPQGLKARVDFACVIPGINPRPTARTSFSTACDSPNAWSDVETAWALRSCGFALSVFRVTRCGESICKVRRFTAGFVLRGLGGASGEWGLTGRPRSRTEPVSICSRGGAGVQLGLVNTTGVDVVASENPARPGAPADRSSFVGWRRSRVRRLWRVHRRGRE